MRYNKKKFKDISIISCLLIVLNLIFTQPISKHFSTSFNFHEIALLLSPAIVATIVTLIILFFNFSLSLIKKLLLVFGVYVCSFFIVLFFIPILIILIT